MRCRRPIETGRICATRLALLAAALLIGVASFQEGRAEYGDIVLNERAESEGMSPVIFPHWFHRIRFQCRVCHLELGFRMRAGANQIRMADIAAGAFCGACHNGRIAWSTDNCGLCHSGRDGLPTGVVGGHETGGPGVF